MSAVAHYAKADEAKHHWLHLKAIRAKVSYTKPFATRALISPEVEPDAAEPHLYLRCGAVRTAMLTRSPCQDMVAAVGSIYAMNEHPGFNFNGFDMNLLSRKRLRLEHDV